VPDYTSFNILSGKKRILVFNEALNHPSLNNEIRNKTLSIISTLRSEGHKVDFADFDMMDYILPAYYILTAAEASSNLSRYDGVKYGNRSAEHTDIESMYINTRSEGFGKEVIRRIILGTFVLSASYYDDYYTKAQKIRSIIKSEINDFFKDYDFILLPTTPTPPYKIGELNQNPLEMYLADLYTVIASLAGNPAISIPNGYTNDQLPVGLQLIANDFNEKELLAFSAYILSLNQMQ
jgi:aspartyl-tRNA(Asn)/glutamyl-tRNA(Gln) amidotransferase subunit A